MAVNPYPFAVKEQCEPRIALYPLRYSAQALPEGGAAYAYDLPSLEQGFPPLMHAQYGLRCIGGGFIYLFDETQGEVFVWRVDEDKGQFIELQARNHSLAGALEGYRPGAVVRHLWARACSVVHLLLTDTLLTERKIRDIQLNRDGIRARLATTIDMQAWTAESPARHTFAAEHIGSQVEEYKGTNLDFSPWPVRPVIPMAQALLTGMKAVASAKQVAVVMHDHIALVQDLGGLINHARQTLERYTSAPDDSTDLEGIQRYRKKLIAELIERIYESAYRVEKHIEAKDVAALERSLQKDVEKQDRYNANYARSLSVHDRDPHRHSIPEYVWGKEQLRNEPTDPIEKRAAALAKGAHLYARHIREGDRRKFLRRFAEEVEQRHGRVIDHKNDRFNWLQTYQRNIDPKDLGSTFLRYDVDDPMSSTSHAVAFAFCIDGMIWGTETIPPGKTDRERHLFEQWWTQPWQTNPILTNIEHDKGLTDAIWDSKMDVATDTAMSKGLGQLLRFAALHYLMEQVSVYSLSRTPHSGTGRTWHGAARNAVAERIHQLAGTGSVDDASRLVQMLETRYQDRLTIRQLTRGEALNALESAARFPRGTVAVGSLATSAGDVMEVIVWERLTALTRWTNPYLQVFERGVAGGVAFFSFLNLKQAAVSFDFDKFGISLANTAAAVLGAGSALNGALVATRALMPEVYLRASFVGIALRKLVSVSSLRRFGYSGALMDSMSSLIKAAEQRDFGNHQAALSYALASAGLGLGGAALTQGGAAMTSGLGLSTTVGVVPVWGWLVAGSILLGLGLLAVLGGDKARFSALNYWLNDSSFGKRETLGQEKTNSYTTLEGESNGYIMASYAPRQHNINWHITSNMLDLTIDFPLAGTAHRVSWGLPGMADGQLKMTSEEALESGGCSRTYQIYGLIKGSGFNYEIHISYTPHILSKKLAALVTLRDEATPWYY